jgi:hypothetical protein
MEDLRSAFRSTLPHRLSLNFTARADGITVNEVLKV